MSVAHKTVGETVLSDTFCSNRVVKQSAAKQNCDKSDVDAAFQQQSCFHTELGCGANDVHRPQNLLRLPEYDDHIYM